MVYFYLGNLLAVLKLPTDDKLLLLSIHISGDGDTLEYKDEICMKLRPRVELTY